MKKVLTRRQAIKQIGLLAGSLWLSACSFPARQARPLPPAEITVGPKKNKTIALLGATGMTGGYILREALVQGYDIRALARTPAKLDTVKDQIAIIKGDARDFSTIQALLHGTDAVVSAIGPVKADGNAASDICTVTTGHVIRAMQAQNIGRYILVSGAAVSMPGDDRSLKGWFIQKLAQLALEDAVNDKQAEYELLVESPVQWTLVRCPLVDPEPFQHEALATLDTPAAFHLRAGELARFMIEQIESQAYIRKGPFLGSL